MKNAITREEMEELLKSKYVYKVTMQRILFTKEFVLKFYDEIVLGKSPIKIFSDAGIPLVPHITDNIRNLKRRMVNAVEKNKFAENNARIHNQKTKTDDLDIVKLKRENELLKQELEFLKKITNQVK